MFEVAIFDMLRSTTIQHELDFLKMTKQLVENNRTRNFEYMEPEELAHTMIVLNELNKRIHKNEEALGE